MRQALYLTAGWISLALGTLGLALPLLPTTPFLILAAFCFSRSSRRLHAWLLERKYFGRMIRDWESGGVIRKNAKIQATALIVPTFAFTLALLRVHWGVKMAIGSIGAGVLVFLWTRPSQPRARDPF